MAIAENSAARLTPAELDEWLESLEYVLERHGPGAVSDLMYQLETAAHLRGVDLPFSANTPYINSIPADKQPRFPGNRELERRIKSIIRWNAMAMVVRANRESNGIGGHISTFASAATLYEIGFNHFFKGKDHPDGPDQIYFQGHAAPGMYARAFVEGRLTERNLENFRREMAEGGGLSSYPHPWLMPGFWEYPTVSMGLAPIMAIYQARFNRYLTDRGVKDCNKSQVWAFLGDGETDEPETLGAITLASRERLDNLTFVINCNLQRLDGPVRGNGKIIQELEAIFRGAGWNVYKVIWGADWDPLLEEDQDGLLVKRMGEVVDGQYQKYVVSDGAYIRENFFGADPKLLELVKNYSDDKLFRMRRGGHDPEKVYAAYAAASARNGKPSVILAKTVKGYGMGEAGEGRNVTHSQKKLNEEELREFRSRFGIPISDDEVAQAPFYRPADDSPEMEYLKERRKALGGPAPIRRSALPLIKDVPTVNDYADLLKGSTKGEAATTQAFVNLLTKLCRDPKIGKQIVPIVPDESRTFGMEGMFRQVGIYSHVGQLYEPVDSGQLTYYKEAKNGQLLEEGITEAGSMSSFVAAGTAYNAHGINMIPFYIYYSMFGFQRIGDLIWAACDARAKGFLIGGTAGRTTLAGEGLQHQDGHSHVNAIAFPTVRAYDPGFGYEIAVIVLDGIRRMYQEGEDAIYYITVENEKYAQPAMPEGAAEGIVRGIYQFNSQKPGARHVQLFGSGAILNETLRAQKLLNDRYDVTSNVWSVTSYNELRRDAQAASRWNMLHPDQPPRKCYYEQAIAGHDGPFIAASDYLRTWAEQLSPWTPGGLFALGCEGFGRSEAREELRRHFEVDAEFIAVAALSRLVADGKAPQGIVQQAISDLGIDPEKVDPAFA